MPSKAAESIAECALRHYNKNISKGKPKDQSEWTVFAAIVAQAEDNLWVVSAATGTKCTAIRKGGFVLHDSHAEILARRGLVRVLWLEIAKFSESQSTEERLLLEQEPNRKKYKLRQNTTLHLYVSDSPCGDASIYGTSSGNFFTGAKVVVSKETGVTSTECGGDHQLIHGAPIARENSQVLSSLRCKSGRSNIPWHLRSTSMSCSDKIVKWSILGLQGSQLSKIIEEPVLLSGVVVSQDPRVIHSVTNHQLEALERAIPSRARAVWKHVANNQDTSSKWQWKDCIPSVHVVRNVFPSGKSTLAPSLGTPFTSRDQPCRPPPDKKIKQLVSEASPNRKVSPCGFALNWQCTNPDVAEVLIGARGVRQGRKPKTLEDYQKLSSRLSRQSLLQHNRALLSAKSTGYQALKTNESDSNWRMLKTLVLSGGPLSGWLREEDDFSLHLASEGD